MRKNKKILIVDDEKDFCYFMKKDLEMTGNFKVSICSDGTKSIKMARTLHPDLILLDVMMPRISGPAVAGELKSNKDTKDIPIVYLTAFTTKKEKDLFLLSKPVNVDDLIDTINRLT